MLIFFILFLICINAFLIDFRAWGMLKVDAPARDSEHFGKQVSVLIAARNEEKNLAACLDSLLEQDYLKDRIEILIIDDESEDLTHSIAHKYASEHANIRLFQVKDHVEGLNGKANALQQLSKEASSEYLLFTDADMLLPPTWVSSMMKSLRKDTGIVSGITLIKAKYLFALFQSFDWSIALAYIQVLGSKKIPVTAMGNNMLITRKAFESVNGFHSTKGSLIEDFTIYRAIVKQGFHYRTYFHPSVLGFTKAEKGFGNLLNQRKRWMKGAMQLPFSIVFLLILQTLYIPAILGIFYYSKIMGIALLGLKISMQSILLLKSHEILKLKPRFFYYFIYEAYNLLLKFCLIVYYFVPVKIKWKGRTY